MLALGDSHSRLGFISQLLSASIHNILSCFLHSLCFFRLEIIAETCSVLRPVVPRELQTKVSPGLHKYGVLNIGPFKKTLLAPTLKPPGAILHSLPTFDFGRIITIEETMLLNCKTFCAQF